MCIRDSLCLLPVFGAEYIFGVVLGCFLANLLGSTIVDVIFEMCIRDRGNFMRLIFLLF